MLKLVFLDAESKIPYLQIVMKDGLNNPFKPVAKFRFLDFKKRISAYTDEEQANIQWDDKVKKVSRANCGQMSQEIFQLRLHYSLKKYISDLLVRSVWPRLRQRNYDGTDHS